jgi:tRNA uridine 5-carboxymethylaminomethyl modification enzyme
MVMKYDVIIVGGGHAGCEAALAAARVGASTLMITINMDHIAQMSCNPAIGGIAKGQVVREIDALGGGQGIVADNAGIQFRMLNSAKGPAVWSPRAQCDKVCYQRGMKFLLERQPNLAIKQAMVKEFLTENGKILGITTEFGDHFTASAMVIASGTFLSGKLHYGMNSFPGGRAGDPPSTELAQALKEQLGLRLGRLKTGTPPRILAKTIDFSQMEFQTTDNTEEKFSHFPAPDFLPKTKFQAMNCHMVYSTEATAEIIRANIHQSPMYSGKISGIGTRYCPSFEDKVIRFPHHDRHLLYLEPEGEYTDEYYINGISTSLPPSVQRQMIASVPGLHNAEISRYAYAIEYDFVFPDQLTRALNTKKYPNLFTAGQINGTSGYEEAAGQGLVAGMNAAKLACGLNLVEIPRELSYIGVMIDDLVTKEIIEPYRLFTSRAEYRLRLRQDNSDLRLCQFAKENGLLSDDKYNLFNEYRNLLETAAQAAKSQRNDGKTIWETLKQCGGEWSPEQPLPFAPAILGIDTSTLIGRRTLRQLIIQAHYEGYIERENATIAKLQKLENWKIPADFDYDTVNGLRNEATVKLKRVTPSTLAQAARIDGVTPSEIALLQVHLTRRRNNIENKTLS